MTSTPLSQNNSDASKVFKLTAKGRCFAGLYATLLVTTALLGLYLLANWAIGG